MKVAAVVPAYNEEKTIAVVIEALLEAPSVDEIAVISDGSTDGTAAIARKYPVKVIELPENVGKGGAMKIGAQETKGDILLFIDADLIGLTKEHIENLLRPVINDEADMTIGLFEDGRLATDLAQKIAPFLSGQRAIKRSVFETIPELEHTRYGIEVALSRYAEEHNIRVTSVNLPDMTQIMKEEKRGFLKGFCARMKMYWEIVKSVKM